jgi:hypothetical protein
MKDEIESCVECHPITKKSVCGGALSFLSIDEKRRRKEKEDRRWIDISLSTTAD